VRERGRERERDERGGAAGIEMREERGRERGAVMGREMRERSVVEGERRAATGRDERDGEELVMTKLPLCAGIDWERVAGDGVRISKQSEGCMVQIALVSAGACEIFALAAVAANACTLVRSRCKNMRISFSQRNIRIFNCYQQLCI
jgi:hypothetical protein